MFKPYKLISMIMLIGIVLGACGRQDIQEVETLATTQKPQNQTPISSAPASQPTTSALSAGLDGLDFDTFVDLSYRRWLSRDPETVLELGLSQVYDLPTDQLTDISDEYIRQTQALESDLLSILTSYDRATLSPAQQLTYDIYSWYLTDRVEGHAFMYNDYPINPTVFSVHLDLLQWFTDLRPVTNLQEARDYVTC